VLSYNPIPFQLGVSPWNSHWSFIVNLSKDTSRSLEEVENTANYLFSCLIWLPIRIRCIVY
jgi:hypothetical protein